jgi:hypothetical protein
MPQKINITPQNKNKKELERKKEPPDNNIPSPTGKMTIGEVVESLQPEILNKLKNDINEAGQHDNL